MQTLLNHINFRLEEFTPPLDTKPDVVWDENSKCQRIDSQQFPVPRLLYFLLTRIFKLPTRSLGEKMHWNVAFAYKKALLHKDLKCKAPLIEPNLRRNLGKWST